MSSTPGRAQWATHIFIKDDKRQSQKHNDIAKMAAPYGAVATLHVGPEHKTYLVHQDILCQNSSYFTAALRGNFVESQTQTILLAEEKTHNFDLFVLWLYTKEVLPEAVSPLDIDWDTLADLYVFADRRTGSVYKDAIIDVMAAKLFNTDKLVPYAAWSAVKTLPHPLTARFIWDNTPSSSKIRSFLLDAYVSWGDLAYFTQENIEQGGLPKDFVIDVLVKYFQTQTGYIINQGHLNRNYHHANGATTLIFDATTLIFDATLAKYHEIPGAR